MGIGALLAVLKFIMVSVTLQLGHTRQLLAHSSSWIPAQGWGGAILTQGDSSSVVKLLPSQVHSRVCLTRPRHVLIQSPGQWKLAIADPSQFTMGVWIGSTSSWPCVSSTHKLRLEGVGLRAEENDHL